MDTTPERLTTTFHPRKLYEYKYIYAVLSRRAGGVSIGINLNLDKRCNYDCVYCSVDRSSTPEDTTVSPAEIKTELFELLEAYTSGELFTAAPFDKLTESQKSIKDISFSGNGEPTSLTCFPDCVKVALEALNHFKGLNETKLGLITNATYFHKPWAIDGIELMAQWKSYEIWAKLDAGTQAYLEEIDVSKFPIEKLLNNISSVARRFPVLIQSMFTRLNGKTMSEQELDAYVQNIKTLLDNQAQIKNIQAYTVSRNPAQPHVTPCSESEMTHIKNRITESINLPVNIYI
tara:strand:- start:868 stop:1737 length:870 start_codon:yes stop_codon:yes gene_type:complete